MLLRLAYLGVANTLAMLRMLRMSNRDKDVEILALRHQITVLERQLGKQKVRFHASDRAFLVALLNRLPLDMLCRLLLLVRPDTVLRWHRDLLARRHAARPRPKRPGRLRTVHSIRVLVLRLARENSSWGYRRLHGELLVLGIEVAASILDWKILQEAGIDPAPERACSTWVNFLRSQRRPTGVRLLRDGHPDPSAYARARGDRAHQPTGSGAGHDRASTATWVAQVAKNLAVDLEDTGCRARYMVRDRDSKFPSLFDSVLKDAGIDVVRMPA